MIISGWQYQQSPPTVQCTLEKALTQATKLQRKDLSLVGASRTDAGVHAWGQVWFLFLLCGFNFQVTHIVNLWLGGTFYCRLLISLHLLTITIWKTFMQLWMAFFLLISELERSARHQLNSMLDFLPKVRFTITRYTMIASWIHFSGILLTIVCINSITL